MIYMYDLASTGSTQIQFYSMTRMKNCQCFFLSFFFDHKINFKKNSIESHKLLNLKILDQDDLRILIKCNYSNYSIPITQRTFPYPNHM